MNARRFVARTSREALAAARQAFGDDAVVLSTRPGPEGIEVLAMAGDGLAQIEQATAAAPRAPAPAAAPKHPIERREPALAPTSVEEDLSTLTMSTLSFQDYVRERMLKRRQEALRDEAATRTTPAAPVAQPARPAPVAAAPAPVATQAPTERSLLEARMAAPQPPLRAAPLREPPVLAERLATADEVRTAAPQAAPASRRDHEDMLAELRQVKGLIEERFSALAFMDKLQRQPGQALLAQRLLDCGFSPALVRKLADALPADAGDPAAWAAGVLERNLATGEADLPLEDEGGVLALIGATGVGKTTTTAKIAAAFAARHGAAHLGLITLDAYRVGAQEQLRTYGRILGVPVHTAHDRASLEDLLDLLAVKRMVLIDTAGMAQRDTRTRELLEMLSHRAIRKLLVVNAASQGETIDDVITAYRAPACSGVVLSKVDEAVKLGPALDAVIRHRLRVAGIANGQRVPEDWHRLSGSALVQRALRGGGSTAYRLDPAEVKLVFAATPAPRAGAAARAPLPA